MREIRNVEDLTTNPLLETKFAFGDSRWRQFARTPVKPASSDKAPKVIGGASSASNASNTGASLLQR